MSSTAIWYLLFEWRSKNKSRGLGPSLLKLKKIPDFWRLWIPTLVTDWVWFQSFQQDTVYGTTGWAVPGPLPHRNSPHDNSPHENSPHDNSPYDISPRKHFAPRTVRPTDSLPHGQLAHRHFAPRTFHPMDSSPHGQLAPRTIRPMVHVHCKKNYI